MDIARIKQLTDEERQAYFKTLNIDQLLELTLLMVRDLNAQVSKIPELIYDGMDAKLNTDVASRTEAADLLNRLTSR